MEPKSGSGSHTRSIIRKITIIAETAKSRYTAWNQKKDAACFLSRWSLVRVFAAPPNFSLLNHQLVAPRHRHLKRENVSEPYPNSISPITPFRFGFIHLPQSNLVRSCRSLARFSRRAPTTTAGAHHNWWPASKYPSWKYRANDSSAWLDPANTPETISPSRSGSSTQALIEREGLFSPAIGKHWAKCDQPPRTPSIAGFNPQLANIIPLAVSIA